MNLRHGDSGTLDVGLLVRYLHDELDETGAQAVAGHVASCEACRSLVASIVADMRRASDALRSAAWEPPAASEWRDVLEHVKRTSRASQRNRRLRIAAGWILLAGAAASMASAPVRAWIAGKLASAREPAPVTGSVQVPSDDRAALSFVPGGSDLTITLEARQAAGTLAIAFTDSSRTAVTVTDGGAEQLAWTGDGVRIANVAAASASYRVTVSHGVDRVLVQIGGNAVAFDRAAIAGRTAWVDLRTGTVRNDPRRDEQ